jgi:hypothetical protein
MILAVTALYTQHCNSSVSVAEVAAFQLLLFLLPTCTASASLQRAEHLRWCLYSSTYKQ